MPAASGRPILALGFAVGLWPFAQTFSFAKTTRVRPFGGKPRQGGHPYPPVAGPSLCEGRPRGGAPEIKKGERKMDELNQEQTELMKVPEEEISNFIQMVEEGRYE
jgi:hypothetical protein